MFISQIAIALEWSLSVIEILRMHSISQSHGQRGQMYHIHICREQMMRSRLHDISIQVFHYILLVCGC